MTIVQTTSYIECLKDSPQFRSDLNVTFKKVTDFHEMIIDLSETFSQSLKSGAIFSSNLQIFCTKLNDLQNVYKDESNFKCLVTQAVNIQISFTENLTALLDELNLIKREFKLFSDNYRQIDGFRRLWQKAGDNIDLAHQKSLAIPRLKLSEIQCVDKNLTKAKVEYRQCSLNYASVMERWGIGYQLRLLRVCSAIINCELEYSKCSQNLVDNASQWSDQTSTEIVRLELFDGQSSSGRSSHYCAPSNTESKQASIIEGYLYRNERKSWQQKWQRRWFKVEHNRLYCCKRNNVMFEVVQEDLRICTAKELPNFDRRFCFELITPDRSLVLQAEDEESMNLWVRCLQNGMNLQMDTLSTSSVELSSLLSTSSPFNNHPRNTIMREADLRQMKYDDCNQKLIRELVEMGGNSRCCDCGDEQPRWASCNIGVTLCTECSGAHRSLGVWISRVRSMTMDNWEPEMLSVMFLLGNDVVNFIFESDCSAIEKAATIGIVKPDVNTHMDKRKLWIKMKWNDKAFILKNTCQLLRQLEVYVRQNVPLFAKSSVIGHRECNSSYDVMNYGLEIHCLPIIMLSLTLGVNVNGNKNTSDIPLHTAAASEFWPGCEFLILNGANINALNEKNQTALHIACNNQNTLVVSLLLRRGAHFNILDDDDNDAYQVAVRTANADTVTLLRVHTLNEDTKNQNRTSSREEDLCDIFHDFTDIALKQLEEWFLTNSDILLKMNNSKALSHMDINS